MLRTNNRVITLIDFLYMFLIGKDNFTNRLLNNFQTLILESVFMT